jgi:hypothetical protein
MRDMKQQILKVIIWAVGIAVLAVFTLPAIHHGSHSGHGGHHASHASYKGMHEMPTFTDPAHHKNVAPRPERFSAQLTIDLTHILVQGSKSPAPKGVTCTSGPLAKCHTVLHCSGLLSAQKGACSFLAHNHGLFKAPHGIACTEIYGGPETAHMSGTVNGHHVDYKLTRTDGCQIGLWNMHAPLWR